MNLINIYQSLTKESIPQIEKKYKNKGYGDFKKDLADIVINYFKEIQNKLSDLDKNPDYVQKILKQGAENAGKIARNKIQEVKDKIGYVTW